MNTTQATASTPHVSPKPMSLMADDSQLLGKPPKGYWRNVGGHLKHDKVALVASGLLLLIALAAIFAPWIAPHDPYETNMQK